MTDSELTYLIYKEFLQINKKNDKTPICRERICRTIHQIRDTNLLTNIRKMYKFTNIQRTVNFRNDSHFLDVILAKTI